MTDPNGMGSGLGAEHGQHQQGGNSGPLAQQPLQVRVLALARMWGLGGVIAGVYPFVPFAEVLIVY